MNIIGTTLNELYRIFDILNSKFYDSKLPQPVITIQKGRANNYGWFTLGKVWKNKNDENNQSYEINITANNLNREAYEIVETLLHEMVHYYHKLNDIRDCNNNVHNKKFKVEAERVGCIVVNAKPNGWGYTSCSEELKNYIIDEIKPNPDCFSYFRQAPIEFEKEKKPRNKKIFKYVCPSCGLEIKAKIDSNVLCGDCNIQMEIEDE